MILEFSGNPNVFKFYNWMQFFQWSVWNSLELILWEYLRILYIFFFNFAEKYLKRSQFKWLLWLN